MNRDDIQDALVALQSNTTFQSDANTKAILETLFNLIDQLFSENEALKEDLNSGENQQLKNEINHLKGEQGKPDNKAKAKISQRHCD